MDTNMYQKPVPVKKRGNSFAIASLVLGILSFALFCTCFNVILAGLSLIFGIIYLVSYVPEKKWLAITGMILSVASIVMLVIAINIIMNSTVISTIRNADPGKILEEYLRFIREAGYGDIINSLN